MKKKFSTYENILGHCSKDFYWLYLTRKGKVTAEFYRMQIVLVLCSLYFFAFPFRSFFLKLDYKSWWDKL